MPAGEQPSGCTDEVCTTCSDEGRLAQVVKLPAEPMALAVVRTEAGLEEVDVTLVGGIAPGDRVLVHAGFAVARVEPS